MDDRTRSRLPIHAGHGLAHGSSIRGRLEAAKHSHAPLRIVTGTETLPRCRVLDVDSEAAYVMVATSSRSPSVRVRLTDIHSVEEVGA